MKEEEEVEGGREREQERGPREKEPRERAKKRIWLKWQGYIGKRS